MLSNPSGTLLNWVWTHADPALWNFDESSDGITWTSEAEQDVGSARSDDFGAAATYFRMWGADGSDVQITEFSNVVRTP